MIKEDCWILFRRRSKIFGWTAFAIWLWLFPFGAIGIKKALQSIYAQVFVLVAVFGSVACALFFRLCYLRYKEKDKNKIAKFTKLMVNFFFVCSCILIVLSVLGFCLEANPQFVVNKSLKLSISVGRNTIFLDVKEFLIAIFELMLAILGKGIW